MRQAEQFDSTVAINRWLKSAFLCAAVGMLAGCGGGGGGSGGDGGVPPTDVELRVAVTAPTATAGQAPSVRSQPAGIDCGLVCSARFALDTSVSLTATAPSGLQFSGWTGDCSGTASTCTLRMGAARSVTATFVAVPQAGGWSGAAVLSAGGAGAPRVGIDAAGQATAVWLQRDAGLSRRSVWASRRALGGSWSAPELIEASDTDFFEVELAVDAASGRLVAAWRSAMSPEVEARVADAAGVWGPTARLNGPGNNINDLQVGIDATGKAVATWSQTAAGSTVTSVWSNRIGGAGTWQGPLRVAVADNDRQDLDPSLAVSANGSAFLVWTRNGSGVMASQSSPVAGWSEPSVLAAGVVSTGVAAPRMVADANGNAMAVWAQGARNSSNQIETTLAAKRFANGAWQGNATVLYAPVATSSLGDVRLAANGLGQFAAVWALPNASVHAAQTDAAGTWASAATVRPAGLELFDLPTIGLDANGNRFATWTERAATPAGTPELWLARATAGAGWAQPAVHQTTPDATGTPRIAMNDRGQAAMVWIVNGNEGSRVISRYFTPDR